MTNKYLEKIAEIREDLKAQTKQPGHAAALVGGAAGALGVLAGKKYKAVKQADKMKKALFGQL